ncbi:hypothetical protein DSCA_60690 [Desulfosarcina alkanivorans]|uniref:Uncharacterized protein n=1 Tax=Desulfosarcina alkanivorans TaxID=571177 RepID=A0A5K7YVR7_9BACT|nr:hypothetical protein [Desulfosarcina alkanivorans]BBO72139.1 hypothetical protein DSCA_60690 [Desulfosarcina alkanivorans]
MLAFVGGFAIATFLHLTFGLTWVLIIVLLACALSLQISYTHRLNALLGGTDPVLAFGAKNLKELKKSISVPLSVSALSFLAKVATWGGVCAAVYSFGWFKIDNI